MTSVFPGFGTVLNVLTVVLGAGLGMAVGHRLRAHTRDVVTDCLGLVTLLVAALSAFAVTDPALAEAVGSGAPVLVVLGSLLIGSVTGSLLRIEERLESLAGRVQGVVSRRSSTEGGTDHAARERFIEGWLTASLLFCVGPLTILGALNDGLGRGADQLYVKSALDGFASIAFAASFGWGVAASVVVVAVVQGGLTLVGVLVGDVLPEAHVDAISATGGLVLVALAFSLLRLRRIPVGDLLPALLVAPLLVQLLVWLR